MEIYKIIPHTNSRYEISNLCNIRRVKSRVKNRKDGSTRAVGGKILSQKTKKNGYKEVALYIDNQKSSMKYVHRLMYITFISEIPPLHEINHIDGNKANNLINNLELVTPSENRLHSYYQLGNKTPSFKGEEHHKSKVTDNDVREIRRLYKAGIDTKEIHKKYKQLSLSSLRKICYRSTWKHID